MANKELFVDNAYNIFCSNLNMNNKCKITSTTNTTSVSTGSLISNGGVGIAKDLTVGGTIYSSALECDTITYGTISQIDSTVNSTSTSTGSLIVDGGAGIAKDVHIGGTLGIDTIHKENNSNGITFSSDTQIFILNTIDSTDFNTGSLQVDGGANIAKTLYTNNIIITNTNSSTSYSSGSLVLNGGAGIYGNIYTKGIISSNKTTDSTSLSTGSLIISGGSGIAGNLLVGGKVHSTGIIRALNTQNSNSKDTGSIQCSGGIGIANNLYVGGTSYFGNMTVSNLSAPARCLFQLGDGTGYYMAIGNWNGTQNIKLYDNGNIISAGSIISNSYMSSAGYIYANNTENASSTNTGSLRVSGGAGIANNCYIGGNLNVSGTINGTIVNNPVNLELYGGYSYYNSSGTSVSPSSGAGYYYMTCNTSSSSSKNWSPSYTNGARLVIPYNGIYSLKFSHVCPTTSKTYFISKNLGNNTDSDNSTGNLLASDTLLIGTLATTCYLTTSNYITFGFYQPSTGSNMGVQTSISISLVG